MGHWVLRNAICLIVLVAVGLAVYLAWVFLPFGFYAIGGIGWIAMMLAGPLLLTDLEKRIKIRQAGKPESIRRHAPLTVLKWFILCWGFMGFVR